MSFFDSGIPSEIDFEKKLKIKKKMLANDIQNFALNKEYAKLLLNYSPSYHRAKIALKCLETALMQKYDTETKMLTIRALRWLDRYDDAIGIAEEMSMKFENSAFLYNEFGRIYMDMNELDLAKEKLDTGIRKFPKDEKLMRSLSNNLQKLWESNNDVHHLEHALEISERGLKIKPNEKRFVQEIYFILLRMNKITDAKIILEKFENEYNNEFFELMFTGESIVTSLSLIFSNFHYIEGINTYYKIINENENKLKPADICSLPEIKKNFDKCILLVDETIERYPEYDYSQWLENKLHIFLKRENYTDALLTSEEILAKNYGDEILYYKGLCLTKLKKYRQAILVLDQLLELKQTVRQESITRVLRLECLQEIGRTDDATHEEKILKELQKKQEKIEKDNKKESSPTTPLEKATFEEKLDVIESDGHHHNDFHQPEKNKKLWFETWNKLKNIISWKDDWIESSILIDIIDNVDFDKNEIKKIRILSKAYTNDDKGNQCYSRFKKIKNVITQFNEDNKNCKIEYKIFFTEFSKKTHKDVFHSRYLFDNQKVISVPGSGQIYLHPGHDHYVESSPTETVIVRADYEEIWNDAAMDTESDLFVKELVRYFILKEKDCADIIKKDHPEIVSEVKKEIEQQLELKNNKKPKNNEKPKRDYVTNRDEIKNIIDNVLKEDSEIFSKENPKLNLDITLGHIMNKTKGKFDPKIIKNILEEKYSF